MDNTNTKRMLEDLSAMAQELEKDTDLTLASIEELLLHSLSVHSQHYSSSLCNDLVSQVLKESPRRKPQQ